MDTIDTGVVTTGERSPRAADADGHSAAFAREHDAQEDLSPAAGSS